MNILDADLPDLEVMEGVMMENCRMEVLMEGKVTLLTQMDDGLFYEDIQCHQRIGPGCIHLVFVQQTSTTKVKCMIV